VNKTVLIPRQETEILADRILKELLPHPSRSGTFCNRIRLHWHRPEEKKTRLQSDLIDISPEALATTRQNALQNGVEVEILQGDLLAPFKGQAISSLQPALYCRKRVFSARSRGSSVGAPRGISWGVDRLEFYQRLAIELPRYLKAGGKVYFEIGTGMGEQVKIYSMLHAGKAGRSHKIGHPMTVT